MNQSIYAALLCMAICGQADAQLRKCTSPTGQVTYSDVECANTAKSAKVLDVTPTGGYQAHRPGQQGQNTFERELSGKIAGHLARDDFEHAATLAVTPEHFKMIADAKRERRTSDAEQLAAKRAARPTVCSSFGSTSGTITNLPRGWTNSYNSNSSSSTVCNK